MDRFKCRIRSAVKQLQLPVMSAPNRPASVDTVAAGAEAEVVEMRCRATRTTRKQRLSSRTSIRLCRERGPTSMRVRTCITAPVVRVTLATEAAVGRQVGMVSMARAFRRLLRRLRRARWLGSSDGFPMPCEGRFRALAIEGRSNHQCDSN